MHFFSLVVTPNGSFPEVMKPRDPRRSSNGDRSDPSVISTDYYTASWIFAFKFAFLFGTGPFGQLI